MFLVSGVELVVAACRNGVIGAFPTVNCRSPEQLDGWLVEIEGRLRRHCEARLKDAQARIEQIAFGSDGKPAGLKPFDAG